MAEAPSASHYSSYVERVHPVGMDNNNTGTSYATDPSTTASAFSPALQSVHFSGSNNNTGSQQRRIALAQGQAPNNCEDDSFSISSRLSLNSTTDGIDVLGAPKAPSNFQEWSHLTAARIVCSVVFKRTVLFFILITAALLGLRTMEFIRDVALVLKIINYTLYALLFVFAVEVVISIACYQDHLFSVGWLAMDIVVLLLVIATGDVSLLVLRSFRLLRALRKASGVPALKWAVKAVLRVLPRLVAVVGILLPSMFAIFAILFTNLYQDAQLSDESSGEELMNERYFGRLDISALTLFQIMTGGRSWSVVCTELQVQYPSAWVPMVCFVAVSLFFFGSLIVAVMCDAVSSVNRDRMWKSLDPDHSSTTPTTATLNASAASDTILFGGQGYAIPHDADPRGNAELRRLETKLDDLVRNCDALLRMQTTLRESVDALAKREISHQVLLPQRSRSARASLTMMTIPDVAKAQSDDL
jgi:voltage-gated sodium channel